MLYLTIFLVTIRIKCYAQGGENVLHTHPGEDHAFIILAGMARFFGKDGETAVLTKNHGILIPSGCYYKFQSCGDEPLVLLRIGAQKEKLQLIRSSLCNPTVEKKVVLQV